MKVTCHTYNYLFSLFLLLVFSTINLSHAASLAQRQLLWSTNETAAEDTHVAFRGTFSLDKATNLELQISGSSWYVIWLNGKYFYEGPDRYEPAHPEYQRKSVTLPAGNHLLAVQVHYMGVDTRMMKVIQPFLHCKILDGKYELPISWKCLPLTAYDSKLRRISAQLGWLEWVDTRNLPNGWQSQGFNDGDWKQPVQVDRVTGDFLPSLISNVKAIEIQPRLIAEGKLAEVFGYEKDNPSARFFLRDLVCEKIPQQGIWMRYDLGRVRLSRPKFVMDLPAGTVVEFAYSEQLLHDRVSPWISLSISDSYNMDHFVARGGVQEFFPLTPKGGRFMEVHILGASDKIKIISEKVIERNYYDAVDGSFTSNDTLLNKIWQTGINTYLACAEDALTDNPTRERGQWLGDVGIVGEQIGAVGFSDIKIIRRGLIQFAQCARDDGMVAGLCPGGIAYVSTYAAQWVPACLEYWRLTGDKTILEELYPAAERNMQAFARYLGDNGIASEAGWAFVDWGYVPNEGNSDMALNLHVYIAFQNMETWAALMGKKDKVDEYGQLRNKLGEIISAYYAIHRSQGGFNFDQIGYHRIVLGLITGFIPNENRHAAIAFIKKHILNCFPNNPDAPRLSDPQANNPQLITPYFAHYTFPVLINNDEMDFVLDQYRICWGWALGDNRTTWVEVFDTRWTHSHQWAGCPTWQLSRYALGLNPRFDLGMNRFDFNLQTGSLTTSEGHIPLPGGNTVHVKWDKRNGKIHYELTTKEQISINIPRELRADKRGLIKVNEKLAFSLPIPKN